MVSVILEDTIYQDETLMNWTESGTGMAVSENGQGRWLEVSVYASLTATGIGVDNARRSA